MLRPRATKSPVLHQYLKSLVLNARSKQPSENKPKKSKGTSGTARRPKKAPRGKQREIAADSSACCLSVIGFANQYIKNGMQLPKIRNKERAARALPFSIDDPAPIRSAVMNGRSLYAKAGKVEACQ